MTWFVDEVAMTGPVVDLCRSRTVGAGVDPFQYAEITDGLTSLRDWLPAFSDAARTHQQDADAAQDAGRTVTACSSWRAAAVCWHVATTLPHPDSDAMAAAARASSTALARHLRPRGTTRLTCDTPGTRFVGELHLTGGVQRPPVVLLLPGLDSGRAEFLDLTDALLARGLAVAAIDGPRQGALLTEPPTPDYHHVVSAVLDQLEQLDVVDTDRVAVIGLSLGGLYAQLTAVHDTRITAAATISGPHPFPQWNGLPPFATDTLTLRTGNPVAAEHFAQQLHGVDVATRIEQPLLVVSGTADGLPTSDQARALAAAAPRGQLHLVPAGDHLAGNTRWRWLAHTTDWIAEHLAQQ